MMKKLRTVSLILLVTLFPMTAFAAFYGKSYLRKAFIRVTTEMAMIVAQTKTNEWHNTWFGVPVLQFPTDLWTYQAFIDEINPDFVIETGTFRGGLSLYLAMLLGYREDHGKVITVDIDSEGWRKTLQSGTVKPRFLDRIIFIEGSSTSPQVFGQISKLVEGKEVLVILDSLHTKDHVLNELELYSKLVPVNGYILVNDTHHDRMFSIQGPKAAVLEFLKTHENFILDPSKDRFMVSCFHSGILKRKW